MIKTKFSHLTIWPRKTVHLLKYASAKHIVQWMVFTLNKGPIINKVLNNSSQNVNYKKEVTISVSQNIYIVPPISNALYNLIYMFI